MLPRQRLRFKAEDTLLLLEEVMKENPYRDKEKWEVIKNRLVAATQKNFSIRGVREHVEYILRVWVEENRRNLNNPGTKGEYTKRDRLLQEILNLRKGLDFKRRQSSLQKLEIKVRHLEPENVNAIEINEIEPEVITLPASSLATETESLNSISSSSPVLLQQENVPFTSSTPASSIRVLSTVKLNNSLPEVPTGPALPSSELPPTSTIGPTRLRKNRSILKNPTVRFFEERLRTEAQFQKELLKFKQEKFQFEKEKFKLEEAKFKLEEQKFQLEKEERLTRLQLEAKERQNSIDAVNQQRQLIRMLLNLINKSNIST